MRLIRQPRAWAVALVLVLLPVPGVAGEPEASIAAKACMKTTFDLGTSDVRSFSGPPAGQFTFSTTGRPHNVGDTEVIVRDAAGTKAVEQRIAWRGPVWSPISTTTNPAAAGGTWTVAFDSSPFVVELGRIDFELCW